MVGCLLVEEFVNVDIVFFYDKIVYGKGLVDVVWVEMNWFGKVEIFY